MLPVLRAALLVFGAVTYAVAIEPPTPQLPKEPFAGILDEHPAIQYATCEPQDRVARLRRAIKDGTASLTYREPAGYLDSLLRALAISPESQVLVFSKTGLQRAQTGPQTPRALYFDDSVVRVHSRGARPRGRGARS